MSTEISVSGLVSEESYQSVLNRLSNHTHSVCNFKSHEIGFDRGPLGGLTEDSNLLRLKHTIRIPELADPTTPGYLKNPIRNGWTLTSLGRIEPERLSPEFCIRPFYVCPIIEGNPIEFVSALGYRRTFEFFKRGVQFIRGGVSIEIFRVYKSDKDELAIGGSSTVYLITVTAIIPSAIRSTTAANSGQTAHELRSEASTRIREIQAILKGLCDLGRVEPS